MIPSGWKDCTETTVPWSDVGIEVLSSRNESKSKKQGVLRRMHEAPAQIATSTDLRLSDGLRYRGCVVGMR